MVCIAISPFLSIRAFTTRHARWARLRLENMYDTRLPLYGTPSTRDEAKVLFTAGRRRLDARILHRAIYRRSSGKARIPECPDSRLA